MVPNTEVTLEVEFPFTVPTPLRERLMGRFDYDLGEALTLDVPPPAEAQSTVDLVA